MMVGALLFIAIVGAICLAAVLPGETKETNAKYTSTGKAFSGSSCCQGKSVQPPSCQGALVGGSQKPCTGNPKTCSNNGNPPCLRGSITR